MPTSGDVVEVDLGVPAGSEAGLRRPAVVVIADRVLVHRSSVVQVIPLTGTVRGYPTEVTVPADPGNGLDVDSAAQCQHVRAVAAQRIGHTLGNVGPCYSGKFATRSLRCSTYRHHRLNRAKAGGLGR